MRTRVVQWGPVTVLAQYYRASHRGVTFLSVKLLVYQPKSLPVGQRMSLEEADPQLFRPRLSCHCCQPFWTFFRQCRIFSWRSCRPKRWCWRTGKIKADKGTTRWFWRTGRGDGQLKHQGRPHPFWVRQISVGKFKPFCIKRPLQILCIKFGFFSP